jgi:hypothetical protein
MAGISQKSETGKSRFRDRKLVASLGGVAAEEGIGPPHGTGVGVGDGNQKLAHDIMI